MKIPEAVFDEPAKLLREFRIALICPARGIHLTANALLALH